MTFFTICFKQFCFLVITQLIAQSYCNYVYFTDRQRQQGSDKTNHLDRSRNSRQGMGGPRNCNLHNTQGYIYKIYVVFSQPFLKLNVKELLHIHDWVFGGVGIDTNLN